MMSVLTKASPYAYSKPGVTKTTLVKTPVKFVLGAQCECTEFEPIRDLDHLEIKFDAPGWDTVLLFNFHFVDEWPKQATDWKPHGVSSTMQFHKCSGPTGGLFQWQGTLQKTGATPGKKTVLPEDLEEYITEFIDDDEYAILKFDVLAKKSGTDDWFFVDPGIGIMP